MASSFSNLRVHNFQMSGYILASPLSENAGISFPLTPDPHLPFVAFRTTKPHYLSSLSYFKAYVYVEDSHGIFAKGFWGIGRLSLQG